MKIFKIIPIASTVVLPFCLSSCINNINYNECLKNNNVTTNIMHAWNEKKEVFVEYNLKDEYDVMGHYSIRDISYKSGPIPSDLFSFYYVLYTTNNSLKFCLHQADEASGFWFAEGCRFVWTCTLVYENSDGVTEWNKPLKLSITHSFN